MNNNPISLVSEHALENLENLQNMIMYVQYIFFCIQRIYMSGDNEKTI